MGTQIAACLSQSQRSTGVEPGKYRSIAAFRTGSKGRLCEMSHWLERLRKYADQAMKTNLCPEYFDDGG